MPEITANVKVGLGIIAASAALITGLLGNVLAANISAFFSGTAPKTGKRPVILWAAFFVSATLSVVAGSLATFAPAAPAPGAQQPKVVVTNVNGDLLQSDPKALFIICRDTVETANTSDIPTSVVAVGTELHVDDMVMTFDPTENEQVETNGQMRVAVALWKTPPPVKKYSNIRTIDQFTTIQGLPLPIKIDARSTAAVYVDFAIRFMTALPQSISAIHMLRFPDIAEIKTEEIKCK